MKNWKILSLLIACLMIFSLCACSTTQTESATPQEDVSEAETATEVEAEVDAAVEEETDVSEAEEIEDSDTEEVEETPVVDNTPVIGIGETQTNDCCEFSIDFVDITDNVMPPQPGDWYSYYEAEAGKVYVDLCVAYKNTETSDVAADETVYGTLVYADKYEFTGFSIIEEDSRGDFTYTNITNIAPLTTEYVHYLFAVPEEVQSSTESIVLRMNIGGTDYKIIVREANTSSGEAVTAEAEETEVSKTSGEVTLGEVVTTENSEFYIDYSDITDVVMPPQPGDVYSYYEADSGKVYVDVCFAYKNTSGSNVGADDVIAAQLKYADKYDYSGFSMIEEDSRGDFTYSNITSIAPLTTEYVHFLFEVPEEVQNSSESIVVSFTIDGNSYTYTVR